MRSSLAFSLLAAGIALGSGAGAAQEAIRNRAVRIIEGNPAANLPPAAVPMVPPVVPQGNDRADNAAGIKIELLPGGEVGVGAKMAVRVATEKAGYLVVIDVDSSGKLTQIYPNTISLADPRGAAENANMIARGKPRLIPDPQDKTNFQFVAAEPLGVGMLVAILSDKPVQMIDLPDVPAALAGQIPALDYVRETTRSLKLLPASETGKPQEPKWSFATKFYVIK